jgi:diacylglycerol kinase family enzyme
MTSGMRVSMLYNEDAGRQVGLDHIRELIAEHGHELVCVIDNKAETQRLLDGHPDLVVAAGGDGTIACAARTLARTGTPLGLLPVGTANNIARSVGASEQIDQIIAGWSTARRLSLDLGVAAGAWGRRLFVEGVGCGLLPASIAHMRKRWDADELPPNVKVAEAIATVDDVLSRLEPVEWAVVADGTRLTGKFLLVEVLNVGLIGPNLALARDVSASDGLFDVVVAGEEHREELARHLRELIEGRSHTPSLISRRARQLTLEGANTMHVDDQILAAAGHPVSMHVEPGALALLI